MSLNILHITPSFTPSIAYGGPTKSVDSLCKKLVEENQSVTVFTTTANGEKELSMETKRVHYLKGISVIYFSRITKDHSHLSPDLLFKVLRTAHKFKLIHIHSWWNLVAIFSTLILLAQKNRPIISIRGMLSKYTLKSPSKYIFHHLIGKYLLKKCIIHVTSEKEKQECVEALGKFDSFILPNFITMPPAYDKKTDNRSHIFKFCTLSRIHPVKNIETIFSCLAELDFEWEINIVGGGEKNYIEKLNSLAQNLRISDKVKWHGHLESEIKYQILADTDLYIQLSLTENFGNSIIEAASVNIPVLISDTTGAAEYVKALGLGWVVPLNKDKIITTINEAKNNILKGNYESKADLVRSEFSGNSLTEKYLKAYRSYSN